MPKTKQHQGNKYAQVCDRELDLHGKTVAQARSLARGFLMQAKEDNLQLVRIIVGKGWHNADGQSRLRPEIERLVSGLGYSFRPAKVSEGGEGAMIVRIN